MSIKYSAEDFQEYSLFKCALDMENIFLEQKGTIQYLKAPTSANKR